jgi:hypothetical protein
MRRLQRAKTVRGIADSRAKSSLRRRANQWFLFARLALDQEGRCASSRTWSAGCDGRVCVARRAAASADGEIVWSWRLDAGVNPVTMLRIVTWDGGNKARSAAASRSRWRIFGQAISVSSRHSEVFLDSKLDAVTKSASSRPKIGAELKKIRG